MIKLGSDKIGTVYLGSNKIGKAYLGSNLIFQSGDSPTPPPTPPGIPEFYDRLVFDGTAYINTDIIPPAKPSFATYLGNETFVGLQLVFGVPTGTTNIRVFLNSNTTSTNRMFSAYYASSSASAANKSVSFSVSQYSMFITPNRFGVYGNTSTISGGSTAPSSILTVGNNPTHSAKSYTGEMGIFYVYGSDAENATSYSDLISNYTPTSTLRPCLLSGVAGLWCVETSKFYPNSAGAGSLSVRNLA